MRPGRLNPLGCLRLARLLRRLRPQILHSHMFHANLLARAARLVLPVPVRHFDFAQHRRKRPGLR